MNSQDSAFHNVQGYKLSVNFEKFCSGQSSLSTFSESTRSSLQFESRTDHNLNSIQSIPLLKEYIVDHQAPEKRKFKKKGKGSSLGKRKRQQNRIRKSENQIQELIIEFRVNPEWTKEKVADLSDKTGLSESQVYKWNWDQRKKFNADFDKQDAEVSRDEFGGYCCKKWGKLDEFEHDDNICNLLGLDVNKMALELVKSDLEKRQKIRSTFSNINSSANSNSKSPQLITTKKEIQNGTKTSSFQTPLPSQKKAPKDLISIKQCKEFDEINEVTTPKASYSRSTGADSNQSWITSINKSPQALFEPQPFNHCSPWKYESCHYTGPLPGSNNYQLRMQTIIKSSPIRQFKSPSKAFQSNWNLFSPSPMKDNKEHQLYINNSQFKQLDFSLFD